jgi:hypothetical protein
MAAFIAALAGGAIVASMSSAAGAAASDPYCTGAYGGATPRAGSPLRFGIDAGLAGSAGGTQLSSAPDDPAKDLAGVRALVPPGRVMVVRLNRLFWSDGQSGIDAFRQQVTRYTGAGLDVELQVRYHPPPGGAGDISAWSAYVRHVVETFGANRRVVDRTITNEANVTISPNTSDGYYPGAEQALIEGIEAAHAEALARGFRQLRFGFTYAYRFSPQGDAGFFEYLGAHGGPAFLRALGFVGVDFYPGTIYPPVMAPNDSYRSELAQAAGVVRDCYLPKARIDRAVPIWFTENGVPSPCPSSVLEAVACGPSESQQASALTQLTEDACAYAGTFNITDYRWFNLRDASSTGAQTLVGPTFAAFGLLRDDYSAKPAFAAYRSAIAACGARTAGRGAATRRRRAASRRGRARSFSFTG